MASFSQSGWGVILSSSPWQLAPPSPRSWLCDSSRKLNWEVPPETQKPRWECPRVNLHAADDCYLQPERSVLWNPLQIPCPLIHTWTTGALLKPKLSITNQQPLIPHLLPVHRRANVENLTLLLRFRVGVIQSVWKQGECDWLGWSDCYLCG